LFLIKIRLTGSESATFNIEKVLVYVFPKVLVNILVKGLVNQLVKVLAVVLVFLLDDRKRCQSRGLQSMFMYFQRYLSIYMSKYFP